MPQKQIQKLRIFIDADVLIAGAASPSEHSASQVILRLAEITLIDTITSQQVVWEVERNLREKLPQVLVIFQLVVQRSLQIVPDPNIQELNAYQGSADPKDLPILVAALKHNCAYLVTYNLRHFSPGNPAIEILEPGTLLGKMRQMLSSL